MTPAEQLIRRNAVSESLVTRIMQVIQEEEAAFGAEYANDLIERVFTDMVASTVYSALTHSQNFPHLTPEQHVTTCAVQLGETKVMLEEGIAEGFTEAYQLWANKTPEYIVKIECVDGGSDESTCPS